MLKEMIPTTLYCGKCRKMQDVRYEFDKPVVRQLLPYDYVEAILKCGHKRVVKED